MDQNLIFRNRCRIIAPARTSISVINMNKFAPGEAGGGNLGFAIDYFSDISIEISEKDQINYSLKLNDKRVANLNTYIDYVIRTWRIINPDFTNVRFKIIINNVTDEHIGVASFATLHFCIVYGINWLFGSIQNDNFLRKYLCDNYKEVVNDKLTPGFTTGLSSLLNLYGGFGLIDEELVPKYLIKVPAWQVYLVRNRKLESKSFGLNEVETLMGKGREYDKKASSYKQNLIASLVSSIKDFDLESIGHIIRDIQNIGSKSAEINIYGNKISKTLSLLFEEGIECAYLSAIGPGILIITRKEEDIIPILKKNNLDIIHNGRIDNNGIRIETY